MKKLFKKKWVLVVGLVLILGIAAGSNIKTIRSIFWKAKKTTIKIVPKVIEQEDFLIKSIQPYMSDENPRIEIYFSDYVDLKKIKGYIEITPEIKFYTEQSYHSINLRGNFIPRQSYTVKILKGMPSREGQALKETYTQMVVIPDYSPSWSFESPGMYMSLKGNQTLPVKALNVDKLKVKIHKVYDNNIVYLLNNMSSYRIPDDLGLDVFEKEINTAGPLNEKREVPIDLKEILDDDSRGLFFMNINEPDSYYWRGTNKLIFITDIGIVVKKSESGLLVWLNSLADTSAIAGATVKVFTKTNQQIIQGISDENGLVHFKNLDYSGDKKPFVVTASTEKDLSFIEFEKCILSETDLDVQGRPYINSGYEAFIYSDRGIYRPGEEVRLRALLRGRGSKLTESFPVILDIRRPDGQRFKKITRILSEFGSIDIDLDIPDYALTGVYRVTCQLPGADEVLGDYTFNVEEFMPDRLKVKINTADKRFSLLDLIPINIKAEHLFGAPAKQREVSVICNLKAIDFESKEYKNYVFGDETKVFSTRTLTLSEKVSDDNGEANFELNIPEGLLPPSSLKASINATVKELGGRAVTSVIDRFVDPYPYYIGLKKEVEGYASLNQETRFNYLVVSPEGKKIETPELEVTVSKVIWDYTLKKDQNGRYRYISEDREEIVLEDSIKAKDASGVFTFTPKNWGNYIIRIGGKDNNTHAASFKFYCSGYGAMAWAMERPDRIELKLDKENYNPGDIAKLVIKSPFKGKALIAISRDEILFTKLIELTDSTQEIPITIDQSFEPNAYCSVTIIKPVKLSQEHASCRAYGVIPIMLNNLSHKLDVNLTSPKQASPGDTISIDISVKGSSPFFEPTELSIALVDEGILCLTGFSIPDPFNFFYGKRANGIKTSDIYSLLIPEFEDKRIGSDSSPSAGATRKGFDPKKHLNPISAKRVKPTVLYKSRVTTDQNGKASLKFKIPKFNGNLKVMVVAAGNRDFGNAEENIKITEPLMIQSTLPRFLSSDDEFIVPVSIFNTTGIDGKVVVSLETSEGFTILSKNSFEANLINNQETAVSFKLRSPPTPQKGEITIKASLDKYSTSQRTEIPIRPIAPFTTISGSGAIKAPTDAKISIPGGWLKGTEGYSLSIMSLPGLQFAGGLKFLVKYPYGCIEQTTSMTYPLLYLADIGAVVDPGKFSPNMINTYIDSGIQKILAMQIYTGGFSMWPGYQRTYDWGSIYATDFLVEADKAGYAVPKFERTMALDYLVKILSGKEDDYNIDLKAYSCFVLSKAGKAKNSWIRRLQERKDELSSDSRFYLAASLAALGDKDAVLEILGQGFSDQAIERDTGDNLNSYVKQNATALSVCMDLDPDNPMVPVLVKRLSDSMEKGKWGTTQDNAAALCALGKYTRFIANQEASYSGSVSLGNALIAEFDNANNAKIKNIDLGDKPVNISLNGKGTAYYYWSSEGVPEKGEIEERDKGIKVRRKFFTRYEEPLDFEKIKQGQIIVVDISIEAESIYKNIVVEDLLPAGFEIENARISTREDTLSSTSGFFEPDHIDIRDDRLLLFTDLPRTKDLHYRYVVRAVTKGKFKLPPISASCMYDPSIVSVNGQGEITIGE